MSDLRPFKEVQLQWLRLLLADTSLSPRAVQFATYLVVVRYNDTFGKAWSSHATVCKDLGLKSEKTIQRLIKELDGKWFEIRRGNGQKQSTEYVPSKTSHQAAQELREKEEAGKTDKIVPLRGREGGHSCPGTWTKLSREPGQKCPPIKEKEKTKEKRALTRDLPDEGQSRIALRLVLGGGGVFERTWNDRLQAVGVERLDRLFRQVSDKQGRSCYLLPGNWPEPRDSLGWLAQLSQIYRMSDREVPGKLAAAMRVHFADESRAAA
ncbi:Helix-turn-helix domain-containing protein [Celeribacter baekdonensis]|uniref:Helix-turn-helix domain-containing protein n=1 Tax=Celeribacter baekdonensis TaxID=875171 RepID=A0A1G7HUY1_9RHOB|nr:helix-turn-helix domain-containing protein [Celeribacter baekdonensis]SDF04004.1 Helix-turn-helix domain-containing protein [Celeribacter baekdonensis]